MVSTKNKQTVKEVTEQLKQSPVIGILNMHALPASQLSSIRNKLRGKATIRMVKKSLIKLAIRDSGIRGIEPLSERLEGQPALLLSDLDPFRLARVISENKSEAPAKEGDIAPREIRVTAGPTALPPGPVIGDLQKAKIPASIEGDKIHIKQDTVVAKEGDEISGILAGVLSKLGVTPMEIGLDLTAAWEDGLVYGKDVLFVPQEKYVNDMIAAHQMAFSLAFSIGFPTKETMPLLLTKAHQEAYNLCIEAGIMTEETVRPVLARAHAQMEALSSRIDLSAAPEASSEQGLEPGETTSEEGESRDDGKSNAPTEDKPEEEESKEPSPEGSDEQEKKDDSPAEDGAKAGDDAKPEV